MKAHIPQKMNLRKRAFQISERTKSIFHNREERNDGKKITEHENVVLMGMFGALAAVLMLFEVPLPFLAPSFYGLDFAEVPMLVGTFA